MDSSPVCARPVGLRTSQLLGQALPPPCPPPGSRGEGKTGSAAGWPSAQFVLQQQMGNCASFYAPQQRLYFRPLAQGHGALRAQFGALFSTGRDFPLSFAAMSAMTPGAGGPLSAPTGASIRLVAGRSRRPTHDRCLSELAAARFPRPSGLPSRAGPPGGACVGGRSRRCGGSC